MAILRRTNTKFGIDRRREHHHWSVTVYYGDELFERVYVDVEKARRFAERQKKSPVVKRTRVIRLS